jgi:hypothetical protein
VKEPRPDTQIAKALSGLKDFQRRTVDYVFRRMYEDTPPAYRMLVSDEVGLGKTLVARGLVARALQRLWGSVERIDVVYICSNGDIARQNVRRLEILGDKDRAFHLATRLTLLAAELDKIKTQGNPVNFIALTPGTSFEVTSRLGVARERAHLYWLLREAWAFGDGVAPKNLLQGTAGTDGFRDLIHECRHDYRRGGPIVQAFSTELEAEEVRLRARGDKVLRDEFEELCESFSRARIHKPPKELRERRAAIVGRLRTVLARTCVKALSPDVVILDEFQRFKHLLSGDDDASMLARALFDYADGEHRARVILISATPYKMLTLSADADDEDHYADFLDTLRFVAHDEDAFSRASEAINRFRLELLRLKAGGDLKALTAAKGNVETELRRYIVRTERLAATPDRSGMLDEVPMPLELWPAELDAYLTYQSIAEKLGERDVVEYWKSAPYLIHYLEGYKLRDRLREAQEDPELGPAVAKVLATAGSSMLSQRKIKSLAPVEARHSRLRAIQRECVESGAWRMLWMPPSFPYYVLAGAFADPKLVRFTKRLVFSAWRMVPRSVSTLLSHRVECETIAAFEARRKGVSESKERWPSPLLRFAAEADGRLTGMTVFALLYPSSLLAQRFDPMHYASALKGSTGRVPTRDEVLQALQRDIEPLVAKLTERHRSPAQTDERWYWAAPLLLDLQHDGEATRRWLAQPKLAALWMGDTSREEETDSHWGNHVELLQRSHRLNSPLGTPPADLTAVLAAMALASPGVAALRALQRGSGNGSYANEARNAAARIGWAMRNLLNLPDSIANLRGQSEREPYWLHVLEYCAEGCLQAVLDEYVHVLRDAIGVGTDMTAEAFEKLAEAACGAIGIRPAGLAMDDIRIERDASGFELTTARLRSKFAMAFLEFKAEDTGTASREDMTEATRGEKVREAFNSPFWPFVLLTTSVGQEGLDFHPYCHAVVHWNLPSNPVDLEQREGRIHRYKGHAVRKNVAARFASAVLDEAPTDPWNQLFDKARAARDAGATDLVPFWLYPIEGGARIERHIAALPLSRDQIRLQDLRRTLAVYRMVFGQPRQDDLIEYVLSHLPEQQIQSFVAQLRVDLSPPEAV